MEDIMRGKRGVFNQLCLIAIALLLLPVSHLCAGTTTYNYDELNRLVRVEYLDGTVVDYTYDANGNRTEIIHSVDTTPPTGSISINSGAAATNNAIVTLTLTCTDNTGCFQMQFSNDGSTYSTPEYFAPSRIWNLTSGEGNKTVFVKFLDKGGNWSSAYSSSIILDMTAPTTTVSPQGGTYNNTQSVTLTCNDGTGSGCAAIYYTTDGSTPTASSAIYANPITITANTTLRFLARDVAGNNESVRSETYVVDAIAPVTTASPAAGTYYSTQSVTLVCSDTGGTGCASIYYTTDGSTPTTSSSVYSAPISISSNTTLKFFTRDLAGNSESPKSETYTIIDSVPGIDSYTKLMLHMDGTNGSTTFTDSSQSPKTITTYGNAQISTAQSKFGGVSGYFDGSGDYLSVPDSSDWYFGTGDFTIDTWVRFNTLPTTGNQMYFINQRNGSTSTQEFYLTNSSGTYYLVYGAYSSGSYIISVSATVDVSIGTWYHVALTRSGTSFRLFLNGTQVGSGATDSDAVPDSPSVFEIGRWSGGGMYFNGWLDEFRISKGIARWTGNFTPASGPYMGLPTTTASPSGSVYASQQTITLTCQDAGLGCGSIYYTTDGSIPTAASSVYSTPITIATNTTLRFFAQDLAGNSESPKSETYTIASVPGIDSYTKLMLHMDGANGSTTFTDSSPSPKTVTANGNAQISTAQSKFGGASILFDGSGDYLQIPYSSDFDISTGNFTIDFWYRPSTITNNNAMMLVNLAPSDYYSKGLTLYQPYASGTISFMAGDSNNGYEVMITSSTSMSVGNWYHIEVSRSETTFRLFMNGTLCGSAASSVSIYEDSVPLRIGISRNGNSSLNGRIDEFRFSKGITQHTANFTPPNGPYSAN
jgi:YD repeat-containing protein